MYPQPFVTIIVALKRYMNNLEHIVCDIWPGIAFCKWCGSVLNINLEYHCCLLYPGIADWNEKLLRDISSCFLTTCPCQGSFFTTVREYLSHCLKDHRFLPVHICPQCNIGFVNASSVDMHLNHYCEALNNQQCFNSANAIGI